MLLEEKTIIITGASSGIGKAAAELFSNEGANVVLGARKTDLLESVTEQIRERGRNAIYLTGDVTKENYSKDLVKLALDTFGSLDCAFNNAGIIGEVSPIEDMQSKAWQEVIDTNLTSAYFAAKHQIPAMKEKGQGALLFTSSFVGYTNGGLPGMGAYAASKAGLIGLCQSLAADHGPDGIRVNTLLPGGTKTPMAGDDPEAHKFIEGLHALGRMADPIEIAQTALFLLSENASFVTGSAIIADGGVSIKLA